jgi:hypothetical protein
VVSNAAWSETPPANTGCSIRGVSLRRHGFYTLQSRARMANKVPGTNNAAKQKLVTFRSIASQRHRTRAKLLSMDMRDGVSKQQVSPRRLLLSSPTRNSLMWPRGGLDMFSMVKGWKERAHARLQNRPTDSDLDARLHFAQFQRHLNSNISLHNSSE